MRSYHLMNHPDKKNEGFIRVPLNMWSRKRREGYVFVTAEDEAKARADAAQTAAKKKASKKS